MSLPEAAPREGVGGAGDPPARLLIARQPIFDLRQRIAGYELLYRSSFDSERAMVTNPQRASLQTLLGLFVSIGMDRILGSQRGFVNIPVELIRDPLLEAIPKERLVLEILESGRIDTATLLRCRELHELGYCLALDDYVPDDPREVLLPTVDYVKVDLRQTPRPRLGPLLHSLRRHPVRLVAEKVETREELERSRRLGFDLFQGFYFARPAILSGVSLDSTRTAIVSLLRLLREEEDLNPIETAFKQHGGLAVNLLRLVNSVALARAERIGTLRQALVLLGRQQLERWLLMLLFAGGEPHGRSNLLLQTAAMRGRLMEKVALRLLERQHEPDGDGVGDRAFVVGLLSLVDVLLEMPLEHALEQLGVEEDLRRALLEQEGPLGLLLLLAVDLERGELRSAAARAESLGLGPGELVDLQCDVFDWVRRVERSQQELA